MVVGMVTGLRVRHFEYQQRDNAGDVIPAGRCPGGRLGSS